MHANSWAFTSDGRRRRLEDALGGFAQARLKFFLPCFSQQSLLTRSALSEMLLLLTAMHSATVDFLWIGKTW